MEGEEDNIGENEMYSEEVEPSEILGVYPDVDYRILWLKSRVLAFTGLEGQDNLFHDLITENDSFHEAQLMNFLKSDITDPTDLSKKVVYFYVTYVGKTIQEEIAVWELSQRLKISAVAAFASKSRSQRVKSATEDSDDGSVTTKKKMKKKKKKKAEDKTDPLQSEFSTDSSQVTMSLTTLASTINTAQFDSMPDETFSFKEAEGGREAAEIFRPVAQILKPGMPGFVPPAGQEDKYVLTKKLFDKVLKVPLLHMECGGVDSRDPDLQNVNVFYILRTCDNALPNFKSYEECERKMPNYVIVGSMRSDFLSSLHRVLEQIFKPLIENQFQGYPDSEEEMTLSVNTDSLSDVSKTEYAAEKLTEILNRRSSSIKRPSDFRKIALSIKRAATFRNRKKSFNDTGLVETTQGVSVMNKGSMQEKEDLVVVQSKKDILKYLQQLTESVSWTIDHVTADVSLTMPDIKELNDPSFTDEIIIKNDEVMEQIKETVSSWSKYIQKTIDSYINKNPSGKGPLAEHQYWYDMETGLSMAVEQLKSPVVNRLLNLCEKAESEVVTTFDFIKKDLWKYYNIANENNKFLTTILRYFKIIVDSESFEDVTDCLPSLTESLKIIWILSNHYSKEDKMLGLLERISWQLCQNVLKNLPLSTLFDYSLPRILKRTKDARNMMKKWKSSYMKTREEIEHSGKGVRWEFDQKIVFQSTEYIAKVCNELNQIANTLDDFYNVFGPELKSIMFEPAQIDVIIKKVDALIVPIRDIDYDVYNEFNRDNWDATMTGFNTEVTFLEKEAKFFIDESFRVLISAEEGFNFLKKFKNVKTRPYIYEQFLKKYDAIMEQFGHEVNDVESIFHRGKRNPPLLKYHPPTSGAIYWARQLFHRLKRPVLIFQNVPELEANELKLFTFKHYLDVAKQMKSYEESKLDTWIEKAQIVIVNTMKKNIVRMIHCENGPDVTRCHQVKIMAKKQKNVSQSSQSAMQNFIHKDDLSMSKLSGDTPSSITYKSARRRSNVLPSLKLENSHKSVNISRDGRGDEIFTTEKHKSSTHRGVKITWAEFTKDNISVEFELKFQLNINWDIFEVIREAELMEQLGFELPVIVKDIGIQKDRLRADIKATDAMINEYNKILSNLEQADIHLLKLMLLEIEKCIQPGVVRLNWNSLNIIDYATSCSRLMKGLNSIMMQVNQIKQDLNMRIENEIESYFLFSTKKITVESQILLPCKKYFAEIQTIRSDLVNLMLKAYNDTSPILIKLESLVKGTSTGKCPAMSLFYEKFERKIFHAFITCIARNLEIFHNMLNGNKPVFEIDAALIASEVSLRPSAEEIYNIVLLNVKDLLDRFKIFPRWMHGTCLESKPIQNENNDELTIYTFHDDLINITNINDLIFSIQDVTQRLCYECKNYILRWKKYSNLWSHDINLMCEKFASTKPTLLRYDEKLCFYDNIIQEMKEMEPNFLVGSMNINVVPLLNGIIEFATKWKQSLSNYLLIDIVKQMDEFEATIDKLHAEIDLVVNGLEQFTAIMQAVSNVKKMSIEAEIKYVLFEETFLLLRSYNVEFDESHEKRAKDLRKEWESLYLSAFYRATTLETTFDRYSELTQISIKEFFEELEKFIEDFEANGPNSVGENLDLGSKKIDEYRKKIEALEEKQKSLKKSEVLFDLDPADYSEFSRVKSEFEGLDMIFKLYEEQKEAREMWSKTLWVDLNPQQLIDGMDRFIRELRRLPKHIRSFNVGVTLDANMKTFKNSVPLFVELKHEAMRERHWKDLMDKTGRHFDMTPDRFTLENMFAMELGKYQEIAHTVVLNAVKELAIEKNIKELTETWENMELPLVKHFKGAEDRGYVLGSIMELVEILEDNMLNVHSMAASQFIGPFVNTVKYWEQAMHTTSDVLEKWAEFQGKWLYLEGIFVGGDIRLQLPDEAKRFDDIDKLYRKIMIDASKRLKVIECCGVSGRLDDFETMIAGLEKCQKNLINYLNSKRQVFPRFNFISDDELLGILGSSDPDVIQPHIGKMFDNLKKIEMTSSRGRATAMISNEGEIMTFENPVSIDGKIENWMVSVLTEMKSTNRFLTKKAVHNYGKVRRPRIEWILDFQGMLVIAADQIWWTAEVEEVFRKMSNGDTHAMKNYIQDLNNRLDEVVVLMGGELTMNERKKFDTILTIDVHLRDIINTFITNNIVNIQAFEWESQLRFYWVHDLDNIWVYQCSGTFEYGYEYMGLNGRLVITPLTDRIYLTFTQALSMHLGGAPAGPAGTGKTETTKDLAKALGLLCMVTNCGEGLDYLAIGRTFGGLAQCGAWGCFDEFNRIDVSVLSVISTQLQTIRAALQVKAKRFMFEGEDITLDSKVGVFITMNPGYAGRSELPESVKALFRPVTCVVPDNEMICQIKLFSAGFLTAKVLAKKMTVLYTLAREQLSKQTHYDFGLRALKSVLNIADHLKRSSSGLNLSENVILMRALRDMNLPKFISDDIPLFLSLLTDLFPDLQCPKIKHEVLEKTIEQVIRESGYFLVDHQVDKIIQLYEVITTRHSIMVVGPTGGGKTVILEMLCKVQTKLNMPSSLTVLNPKACTVNELYGILDPLSRDWIDGILSNIFREINRPIQSDVDERRYILFDGDIDALWIENMNSVMDDNKLLTLVNQERIKLQDHCKLLFEVGNLQYASPATVSRAGMVYVDAKNLGYHPFMVKWIKSKKEEDQNFLIELYEKYIHGAVKINVSEALGSPESSLRTIILQTPLNIITQMCSFMDALYILSEEEFTETIPETNSEHEISGIVTRKHLLESMFIVSCYFSFGASLVASLRYSFDSYMKGVCSFPAVYESSSQPASLKQIPIGAKTLFEYRIDIRRKIWIRWKDTAPTYIHDPLKNFWDILVPTSDTLRITWFLQMMCLVRKPTILVGEIGSGKTVMIQEFLKNLDITKFQKSLLNLSPRTTSMDVQRSMESVLEKRTRDILGPSPGKTLMTFIDNLNMPNVDQYGTQQPIAFLKLLIEKRGFYGRNKDLSFKHVRDVYYMGAMGEPGGGRNELDPRFVSLFSIFNVIPPSTESLAYIYTCILSEHLSEFSDEVKSIVEEIINTVLDLYKTIKAKLPPTPARFHYIFNMRDLSRVIAGLVQCVPEHIPTAKHLVRLCRNEFVRVFCDRFINTEDERIVQEEIEDHLRSVWSEDDEIVNYALRDPLLFGDFRNACDETEPRFYEDLLDYEAVYNLFMEILDDYNERHPTKIKMVLFNDALEHLVRVHRALRLQRGHVLVVGIGGMGKQSVVKLASFASDFEIFEISLRLRYNEAAFREDIKKLFILTGVNDKRMVFLFPENQIIDEGFLESINNIVTSGTVPALFTDDEKDNIISSCRDAAIRAGYTASKGDVWTFFEKRSIKNMRIALTMSPTGDKLRTRCRNYPGLVNCTTIDWMSSWPDQALIAVANVFIRDNKNIPQEYSEDIVHHIVHVHTSVQRYTLDFTMRLRRYNYVTPKHYLDFINTYINMLTEKNDYAKAQCDRLSEGLKKIAEASVTLKELNAILAVQRTKISEQTKNCEQLLATIGDSTAIALDKKQRSLEKRIEIEEQKKFIAKEEKEAKQALSEAEPALVNAKLALGELEKADITEIRSFATPPESVQVVCECVVILLGAKDISWKSAKGAMSDPNFLRILQEMKCEEITLRQQQAVKAHMKKSDKWEQMQAISKAGYGLYRFVLAVLDYCSVYKEIKPKIEKVQMLDDESRKAQRALEKEEYELAQTEKLINELNKKYDVARDERHKIQEETDILQRRLVAADKLITGLATENVRWNKELNGLKKNIPTIIGNCLLCSAFLAYCGPFSFEYRNVMIYNDWKQSVLDKAIPFSENFKIESHLSDDIEISTWNSQGLPTDSLSVQNGILTLKASRFPLCIDPQQQATNWIKKKEQKKNLKILTFNDPDYLKQVELAIRYGSAVLFQDVEEVDPILDNVLTKNIQEVSGRIFVLLGDKEIDFDPRFRIYLTSRISNPKLSPKLYATSIIINYTVTVEGLEEQLLAVTVETERPDIEEQRESLITETSEHKNLLRQIEDGLLREIASNTGNMLDNVDLVDTLDNIKTSANEVTTKLYLAEITTADINKLRDGYRPVAKRAALLFFVLADMASVNSMYQYSLGSYLEIFIYSLKKSLPDVTLAKRLQKILPVLTMNVYKYGCSGIFQEHKLLFSFQICLSLEESEGRVNKKELDFFIRGNVAVEKSKLENPTEWLPPAGWEDLVKLSTNFPESFGEVLSDLETHSSEWEMWFKSDTPEASEYPCDYSRKLRDFEKLMLIRCFRMDRVFRAVTLYITKIMGEPYVISPQVNYDIIYEQSSSKMPIMFILSPGADPSAELMKLADKYGCGGGKFRYLSLGQGQEKIALELLEAAGARGQWLLLQNCHLLLEFICILEKRFEHMENPHPDFRLWLTTDANPNFPIGVLQQSLKIVTESPSGLKLSLQNTYLKMSEQTLEACEHPIYKDLIYTLAFYHAVIYERKKFGKIGWNVSYDFNRSDFNVSVNILEIYLKKVVPSEDAEIPWNSIKYLIGEVMYGGRIVDPYDRRVSSTYMDEYFGDFLFDEHQPFHFYKNDSVDYVIPPQGDREEYMKYIEELPLANTPEVFGLHANVEIGYFTQAAKNIWRHLINLQPETVEVTSSVTKESFITNTVNDIFERIPPIYDTHKIKKNFGTVVSPTTIVLFQELERFNQLISVMSRTLLQLQKAIAGEIEIDVVLEEVSTSLYNGLLPKEWLRYAPQTKYNLAVWIDHFQRRVDQYSEWAESLEPLVIWLAGLHIPQTYLAALIQVACRKNDWPLDDTVTYTSVTTYQDIGEIQERHKQGCYVCGLYLEGARWDRDDRCLKKSFPNILTDEMPIIAIIPTESHRLRLQNTVRTPVYMTSDRNNAMGVGVVFEADLATSIHVSHWILQGICLILNPD